MWNKFYALCLFLVALGVAPAAQAQQDPQFSLYMFNPVYYNPATVGSEGVARFQLTHRTQWAGYQGTFDDGGALSTQLFSFNTPLRKLRSGVGVLAMNDRLGPQINQAVQVAYAYRLPLSTGTLSLGVQGGLYNRSVNFDQYRPGEPGDPLLAAGRINQMRPDLAAGLHFNAPTYYIGVSMQHLNQSEFRLGTPRAVNPLTRAAYLTAGYRLEWNEVLDLMPSVLVKTDLNTASFEASALVMYDKRHWVGFSYRQQDAIIATLGVSLLNNNALRFGYSFDFVTGGQRAKSPTSHEVLLSYSLPEPQAGRKPIIRTPRFRY